MLTEYVTHFGLRETPFARNQNPKWLYLSTQHKEAILKTRWTIEEHGGLVLWRGDVGHGKSSLIEYLMTVWPQQFGWHCAKLQNTGTISGPNALLSEVLAAFGLEPAPTTRKMVERLETWLLRQTFEENKTVVLFIDEAQSIAPRAFPVIRDLINLQTRERILLQIVMSGQLTIDRRLKNFPALRSRIASSATLAPLSYEECDAMLLHRFETAGAFDPFRICTPRAVRAIYHYSNGVPRDFITIAEAAMKEAFMQNVHRIEAEHVLEGVRGLAGRQDNIPALPPDRASALPPVRPIHRAAAADLQAMAMYARTA